MKQIADMVWAIPIPLHTSESRPVNRQAVMWWDQNMQSWHNGYYYENAYGPGEPLFPREIAMLRDGSVTHYLCDAKEGIGDGDVYWMPELPIPPQLRVAMIRDDYKLTEAESAEVPETC